MPLGLSVSVPLRGKGRDQLSYEVQNACTYFNVSVPLRGKGRDQPGQYDLLLLRKYGVSVPLRGKGRDQRSAPAKVPSPIHGGVSVPLRGKGRDQLRGNSPVYSPWFGTFPSPCGEKVGINSRSRRACHSALPTMSFRPLAGKR